MLMFWFPNASGLGGVSTGVNGAVATPLSATTLAAALLVMFNCAERLPTEDGAGHSFALTVQLWPPVSVWPTAHVPTPPNGISEAFAPVIVSPAIVRLPEPVLLYVEVNGVTVVQSTPDGCEPSANEAGLTFEMGVPLPPLISKAPMDGGDGRLLPSNAVTGTQDESVVPEAHPGADVPALRARLLPANA